MVEPHDRNAVAIYIYMIGCRLSLVSLELSPIGLSVTGGGGAAYREIVALFRSGYL